MTGLPNAKTLVPTISGTLIRSLSYPFLAENKSEMVLQLINTTQPRDLACISKVLGPFFSGFNFGTPLPVADFCFKIVLTVSVWQKAYSNSHHIHSKKNYLLGSTKYKMLLVVYVLVLVYFGMCLHQQFEAGNWKQHCSLFF